MKLYNERHVSEESTKATNQPECYKEKLSDDTEIENSEKMVKSFSEDLYKAYLDPSSLPEKIWSSVQEYYSNMEDLRIPEVIAKEVVEKIQSDLVCICGTGFVVGDEHYSHLEKYKLNMASADVVTEIFHIKETVISNNSSFKSVDELVVKLNNAKKFGPEQAGIPSIEKDS